MEFINQILSSFADFLWGVPMAILLLGTHLWMTYKTGFVQKKIGTGLKLSFSKDDSKKGNISNFGALMVSLAATMGTGNIIGVGTAVAMGGPGAVFWCLVTGIFGFATKYAESLMAVKYRIKDENGNMIGGAMVVLDKALHKKWLAVCFCITTIVASFGIGNMNQANAVSTIVNDSLGVPPAITGVVMAVLVVIIMYGGLKWLSTACRYIVPFMAGFYILGCIALLCLNYSVIDDAIILICKSAFTPTAIGGGAIGGGIILAMRFGLSRGLFSNEAGLGSSPIISAAAKTNNAARQGIISATCVFWDTIVVCTLTGLVIVSSVIIYPDIDFHHGAILTSMSFAKLHPLGSHFLATALAVFTFSTLLGWFYYAECCIKYLGIGSKIKCFYAIWAIAIVVGSALEVNLVWTLSDISNALMAIPNLIAVLCLSKVISSETKKYLNKEHINDIDPDMER